METIQANKKAIANLVIVKDDFDSIIESLELMSDKNFMRSYNKAKIQIQNKEFDI